MLDKAKTNSLESFLNDKMIKFNEGLDKIKLIKTNIKKFKNEKSSNSIVEETSNEFELTQIEDNTGKSTKQVSLVKDKNLNKENNFESLKNQIVNLPNTITHPYLKSLCKNLSKQCQSLEEKNLDKISLEIDRLLSSLTIRREKITGSVQFGDKELSNREIFKGKKAVRLSFDPKSEKPQEDWFAIKTDGYLYFERPKGNFFYVPYSEDGKFWVLLNIGSIRKRNPFLSLEEIKQAAEGDMDGKILKDLLDPKDVFKKF